LTDNTDCSSEQLVMNFTVSYAYNLVGATD